jgi:hypothetical protein
MTPTPRPWWASEDATAGLDDLDPVEAFRAVRRPGAGGPDRRSGEGAGAAGASRAGPAADPAPDPAPLGGPATDVPHRPELCGVCPLCTLARTLEESRPELLEHLTEAARHLSAAVRSLLEPPGPTSGRPGTTSDRLQHIDLERDEPDGPATDPGGRT